MYLASSCNSTIIEMCDDMIRISHGFRGCQLSRLDSNTSVLTAGINDITSSNLEKIQF